MKYLTLNTHSWNEVDWVGSFKTVFEFMMKESPDVICLQEVNQLRKGTMGSPEGVVDACFRAILPPLHQYPVSDVGTMDRYRPVQDEIAIRMDNYAKLLVWALAMNEQAYYWTWALAHIGYEQFDEGVAILSKQDFTAEQIVMSDPMWKYHDYQRRVAVKAVFEEDQRVVYSGHFSWWESDHTGFEHEWNILNQDRQQYANGEQLLFGDFNQIADQRGAGYDYIRQTAPDLRDSYKVSPVVIGDATIPGDIDGWHGQSTPKRIDYAWVNNKVAIERHETVFDGENYPTVSDHFGILVATK
ncbi:MAG: endonuclease/exonuclease/phosphatase family protein [Aerococcus sp.]|nr:endonuclease/exonuclease/phosphatase family protein [Aerococcus sp.]